MRSTSGKVCTSCDEYTWFLDSMPRLWEVSLTYMHILQFLQVFVQVMVEVSLGLPKLIDFRRIFSYMLFLSFSTNPFSNTIDLKQLTGLLNSMLQLKQLKKKSYFDYCLLIYGTKL